MKKGILQRTRTTLSEIVRLAVLAVAATLGFTALLLLGNFALYTMAQIVEALFDLVRFLFEG